MVPASLSLPAEGAAQLSRVAIVQPVAEVARGDALIGLGVRHDVDATFTLSGLTGDLTSLGVVHVAYGIGPRALVEVRGASWQILSIDTAAEAPPIALDPGVADGVTTDAGDFELGFSFLPIGARRGFSAGGHVFVKLPNSDETKGIGPNTTDVTIAALASWGDRRWRASGWVGVGILEAPERSFEQNDVVAYAFDWLWRPTKRLRVGVGARGRASTRGRVPLGTEDLGELRLGAEWSLGSMAIDVALSRGFARLSGEWAVQAGAAWTLARGRRDGHRAAR